VLRKAGYRFKSDTIEFQTVATVNPQLPLTIPIITTQTSVEPHIWKKLKNTERKKILANQKEAANKPDNPNINITTQTNVTPEVWCTLSKRQQALIKANKNKKNNDKKN